MEIQGIGTEALLALGRVVDLSRPVESQSELVRAVERDQSREAQTGDRLSVRQGTLRRDLSALRQSHTLVRTELAQRSVAQVVQAGLSAVQEELSRMQSLAELVSEEGMSEEQLAQVQNQIEGGMARIEELISATTYGGEPLLTGDAVRIITDVTTEEGFDVSFPEVSVSALGLNELDVVNQESAGDAEEIVGEASAAVESIAGLIGSELAAGESRVESQVAELQGRFSALSSHELLGSLADAPWREVGQTPTLPSVESLQVALSSLQLDAEMVTSLLA